MAKTAVVILNYNGRRYLQDFLPIVEKYTKEADIVVADNASADGSVEFLRSEFPHIRLIVMDKNYGFAEGYNRALAEVEAKYYVLLNSDVEVSYGWLGPMEEFLDNNSDVLACQPKILSQKNKKQFEYAGASGGFIDSLGYPFCRGRILNYVEEDLEQYDEPMEIDWASGACLMIRSDVYRNLGGLDGRFFAYQEEIDLCQRILGAGGKIMCLPQSSVYHVGNGTLGKNSPFQTYLNFRNNLLMIYKNAPRKRLRYILFCRFFLDYMAAVNLLCSGQWKCFLSVFRARREFRKIKRDFLCDREKNVSQMSLSKAFTCKPILLQYYLRRKRKFSEIFDN